MVKSLSDYRNQGSVVDITPQEKKYYESFLQYTYQDNIATADFVLFKHPRWTIISAYYSMHDISKLYLARKFNIKFSNPEINSLHLSLLRGKKERGKTQYYTDETIDPKVAIQKASYFLEKLSKPYIQIMEKLIL